MTGKPLTDTELQTLLNALRREESFVFLETGKVTAEEHRSLLFRKPAAVLTLTAGKRPADFFQQLESYRAKGYYLAGWFAYEFGYLLESAFAGQSLVKPNTVLAELGVFPTPHIYDHASGAFNGAGPWPTAAGTGKNRRYAVANLRFSESEARYLKNIARIKKYIEAGDTYQVNYTLKLLFDFTGSPEALYRALRRGQSVSFGAYLRLGGQRILSFSPELFFRKNGEICTVRPMKGTMRRGATPAEDARLADNLKNDSKNRSENVMIVDLLRNDLGRLCQMGTVAPCSMFDIETYETLHQMTSTIRGAIRPGISLHELFRALFPCGSVTGAPKIRTMEIIRELEPRARGVYTGAIGYLAPDGDAVFNVPIRTVALSGAHGEMGIGSGVVHDSGPSQEWRECRLKGRFLSNPAPDFSLIETLIWEPEKGYWLLDLHLERLMASAEHLGFYVDEREIAERLARESEQFTAPQRVRLMLGKDGGLKITATEGAPPSRQAITGQSTAHDEQLPEVVFSPQKTDSRNRYLYHKTTLRNLYDEERKKALKAGYFEVLFCNERGEVTEGAVTNLFIRKGAVFFTPPVDAGLLPGVFRRSLLETSLLPVREKKLTQKDIMTADALYVGNSVRGLVHVRLAGA